VAEEGEGRSHVVVVVVREGAAAAAAAGRTRRVGRQEAHRVENTAAFRHVRANNRATVLVVVVVVLLLLRVGAWACAVWWWWWWVRGREEGGGREGEEVTESLFAVSGARQRLTRPHICHHPKDRHS